MSTGPNEIEILTPHGGTESNSLLHVLNLDAISDVDLLNNEPQIMKPSPYYDTDEFISYLKSKQNLFTVLSFNSQSLNAKFDELLLFTETLNQNNCCLSAICIQETWFDDISDTSRFNLEGYNLISQGKHCSEKGGLLIYLRNSFSHKVLKLSEKSNIWEGQFIEINNNKMPQKIVIGNLYRPPRDLNAK